MSNTSLLVSPWGHTLGDTPLPDYPRPMLERQQWRCLNGHWRYAVTQMTSETDTPCERAEPRIERWAGNILVPFAIETAASGVERPLSDREVLHYGREIDIPQSWRGKRVAVNFEAVDYRCAVWIDGVFAGAHRGGYLPFSLDIPTTDHEKVRVHVAVADPSDVGYQQRGKQALNPKDIWYRATSGIWQSVWMEPLPKNAITSIVTRTREDLSTVDLLVCSEVQGCPVRIVIDVPDGSPIKTECTTGSPTQLHIPHARLWSPDDPFLYRIHASTDEDEVSSWMGLRTVALSDSASQQRTKDADTIAGKKRTILLNGRPFFLNAPLDQGYWPESGMTAPAEQALTYDLRAVKNMGFNGVRVHIKVESRRFYHLADRLGLVLVQDAVSGGRAPANIKMSGVIQALDITFPDRSALFFARTGRSRLEDRVEFLTDWIATIHHLEAHPSLLIWVPFNEGWGQFDARSVDALTRRTDPTRLIDASSGWFDQGSQYGDFRSRHRYVLRLKTAPRRDPRAFYLSEFGGLNCAIKKHTLTDCKTFGYRFFDDAQSLTEALASLYRKQLLPLVSDGLAGATYTQLSDVEQETNGLITFDRRVIKIDPAFLAELNTELYRAFEKAHPA